MKLAIIGAGELGKLIAHHAVNDSGYELAGYYDDFVTNETFNGSPVLGKCDKIFSDHKQGIFDELMIGIGYDHMKPRSNYFEKFYPAIPFANIIHSSAYIDPSCSLGKGIFILPGTVLDFEVIIGNNVLINTGGIIAHHSKVLNHTFIAPAVQVAGLVTIHECCFIGIGATIIDCINIAKGSVIGAGSVVIKNTETNSVSVGVPAKFIKYQNE
jgi:sugar O-acyltransferase (sialic acid O-acetyltransferase NeuD family)